MCIVEQRKDLTEEVVIDIHVGRIAAVVDDHVVAYRQRATALHQEGVPRLRPSAKGRRNCQQTQQQDSSHALSTSSRSLRNGLNSHNNHNNLRQTMLLHRD